MDILRYEVKSLRRNTVLLSIFMVSKAVLAGFDGTEFQLAVEKKQPKLLVNVSFTNIFVVIYYQL